MSILHNRLVASMDDRREKGLERELRLFVESEDQLNLADNDYLRLARSEKLATAAKEAADRYGVSSSASPLITGFGPSHGELIERLKLWHGFAHGLVWNTGYSANQAVLSKLPQKGDIVLADRLIHHSMISGILASGARLIRYAHLDISDLESLLAKYASNDRQVFVVTESVFSMDGDYPDLRLIAELKSRFSFFWILDEAHALGWYGAKGSGLAEECGCIDSIDIFVGTLGKGLGSMGAYTLFNDEAIQRYLVNFSGEFIYSTYLSPVSAAVGTAAINAIESDAEPRIRGRELSRWFRGRLQSSGFKVPDGDSPIVPIAIGSVEETLRISGGLREIGIYVGAIRPPTVPESSSRLRVSLNSDLEKGALDWVVDSLISLKEV